MEELSNFPITVTPVRLKEMDFTTIKVLFLKPLVRVLLCFSPRYSLGISVVADSSLDNSLATFVDSSLVDSSLVTSVGSSSGVTSHSTEQTDLSLEIMVFIWGRAWPGGDGDKLQTALELQT